MMWTVLKFIFVIQRQICMEFTEPPRPPDLLKFHLVDMYMSCAKQIVKKEIIKGFTYKGSIRVLLLRPPVVWEKTALLFMRSFTWALLVIHNFMSKELDMQDEMACLLLHCYCTSQSWTGTVIQASSCNVYGKLHQTSKGCLVGNFDMHSHIKMGWCLCCDIFVPVLCMR